MMNMSAFSDELEKIALGPLKMVALSNAIRAKAEKLEEAADRRIPAARKARAIKSMRSDIRKLERGLHAGKR
jgi:hypothetical protein